MGGFDPGVAGVRAGSRLSVRQSNASAQPGRHAARMSHPPTPFGAPSPAAVKTTAPLTRSHWSGISRRLSAALRMQMAANLPAGDVVDHLIGEVLSTTPPPLPGREVWAPTPSMVSADVVLRHGDPSSTVMTAVVAGMRSPGAVRELAMRPRLAGEVRSALLFNSTLAEMPAHVGPAFPEDAPVASELAATGLVSAVDAALRGETTRFALEDWWTLPDPGRCAVGVRTTYGRACDCAGSPLPASLAERPRPSGTAADDAVPAMPPLGDGSAYVNMRTVVGLPTTRLTDAVRRMGLHGVIGRHLGEKLFEVTGDDPSAWSVAVDLLESWEGSLDAWLETIGSLA